MYNTYSNTQSTENSITDSFDSNTSSNSYENSLSMKESYGSFGRNYRYNGNKHKKSKSLIKIKNKPSQKFKYSRDKKTSNLLSTQTTNLFKKDVDLSKTKIDKDYSMRTSKRKLPKEVQTAGVIIIGALLTAIVLKIALSEKKSKKNV